MFPTAASAALPTVGAKFEVHPQHIANRLLALHKLAVQLDRVVGPRHPDLLPVGHALASAMRVAEDLRVLGFLLVMEEAEGLMAVRRRQAAGAGGAAGAE